MVKVRIWHAIEAAVACHGFLVLTLLACSLSAGRVHGAVGVVISEYVAVNRSGLTDQDGQTSDWIEIHNGLPETVDLAGWVLTDSIDSPFKWVFPEGVELGPGQFLVVFASGKNQADPAAELHTNFGLESGGEFLALLNPRGEFASVYLPAFPPQLRDVSYGLASDSVFFSVVTRESPVRVHVPPDGSLGLSWTDPDFDDADWLAGLPAVGFGGTAARRREIGADVETVMKGINASLYVRIPFELREPAAIDRMTLSVRYDDAFVAYLNGRRVLQEGTTSTPLQWDSKATSPHSATSAVEFDLSRHVDALRPGTNVLAFHVLNISPTGTDLFLLPELELVEIGEMHADTHWYFPEPSPGGPNRQGFAGIAPRPEFSHDDGIFLESPIVDLSTELEGAVIRFSLDDTIPNEFSEIYSEPIATAANTKITARVFVDGLLPSPPESRVYVTLGVGLEEVDSNIPIVVCTTLGRSLSSSCGSGPYTTGHVMIFEPDDSGRVALTDTPTFSDIAAFRKRGSSTCGRPKFSFNMELRDHHGDDRDVRLLDFPPDSDYVMYGPYNFDRALMRNPIAYWMSREVGQWAARTRFVECYFHSRPGAVAPKSYMGVYVLMEKNKRHPEKVDIESRTLGKNGLPRVDGGYLLRRDRSSAGEVVTGAGGYSSLVFVYPKAPTGSERQWITRFINEAIGSIGPHIGSQEDSELIDVTAFLDHHILNFYPKNVDAFRLSGYFHKARNGLLAMGPVWDYDRTMGCSDDSRAATPTGWTNNSSGDGGTRYFEAGGLGSWYSKLFVNQPPTGDSPWDQAYRARWHQLRRGPLKTANILDKIDEWADEIREAADRNYARWGTVRPRFGGFQGEVDHLKNWLATRADWIDGQFTESPRFARPGGLVERGFRAEILINSDSPVYFTVDGTDPRGPNGEIAESARIYRSPIVVDRKMKIWARAREREVDGLWTGSAETVFYLDLLPLVVTEIMYNPVPDPDRTFPTFAYEFLELRNASGRSIDLEGVTLSRRLSFTFAGSDVTSLGRDEYIVLVRSRDAFVSRYGTEGIRIAGQYAGVLLNTGQRIEIQGDLGEVYLGFDYSDDWDTELTDGGGHSLVVRDAFSDFGAWSQAEHWRASVNPGGSPGRGDFALVDGGQIPGDISQDRRLSTADVIGVLRFLFRGASNLPCAGRDANTRLLDTNGDLLVDLSDAVVLLNYLFRRGMPPVLGSSCVSIFGCPDLCATP